MDEITAKPLEAFTATDDGRILRESGGIVGRIRAGQRGVTVWFRYEYKREGSKRDHILSDQYPNPICDPCCAQSLQKARSARLKWLPKSRNCVTSFSN